MIESVTHLGPYELNRVHLGDCIELMKGLDSCSVDSCVTDPPYELGFMGKSWDSTGIAYSVELWQEVLRVLKPGAHLLAFGGTRTYHRMACAIEDAGFEIRDCIQWLYGSGFPKSHNLKDEWQGWGTALKPANEPICVARKPFNCTVAENVLQWGTGAINVDAGRIESNRKDTRHGGGAWSENIQQLNPDVKGYDLPSGRWPANIILDEEAAKMLDEQSGESTSTPRTQSKEHHLGTVTTFQRGSETSNHLDSGGASRFFYAAKASKSEREAGLYGFDVLPAGGMQGRQNGSLEGEPVRRKNHHPTVKPVDLMRYLVNLVTPRNGIVLDPFTGSGTTGCACIGFRFIGFELDQKYCDLANKRIEAAKAQGVLDLTENRQA